MTAPIIAEVVKRFVRGPAMIQVCSLFTVSVYSYESKRTAKTEYSEERDSALD